MNSRTDGQVFDPDLKLSLGGIFAMFWVHTSIQKPVTKLASYIEKRFDKLSKLSQLKAHFAETCRQTHI